MRTVGTGWVRAGVHRCTQSGVVRHLLLLPGPCWGTPGSPAVGDPPAAGRAGLAPSRRGVFAEPRQGNQQTEGTLSESKDGPQPMGKTRSELRRRRGEVVSRGPCQL